MADLDMTLTDTQVRKWGRARVGISDYGAAGITVPTAASGLFDGTSFKPKAWPAEVYQGESELIPSTVFGAALALGSLSRGI